MAGCVRSLAFILSSCTTLTRSHTTAKTHCCAQSAQRGVVPQCLDMLRILLIFGFVGILTSTTYLALVFAATIRFRRRPKAVPAFTPAVSVLKPLHGAEPGLREFLEGFFQQDYPEYEILFCARHETDHGLAIARELSEKYPRVPARIMTSGEPPWPNAKCYSMNEMKAASRHDILVISDSDVRVTPGYLRAVV